MLCPICCPFAISDQRAGFLAIPEGSMVLGREKEMEGMKEMKDIKAGVRLELLSVIRH